MLGPVARGATHRGPHRDRWSVQRAEAERRHRSTGTPRRTCDSSPCGSPSNVTRWTPLRRSSTGSPGSAQACSGRPLHPGPRGLGGGPTRSRRRGAAALGRRGRRRRGRNVPDDGAVAPLRLGVLHAHRQDPAPRTPGGSAGGAIATEELSFYLPEALLLEGRLQRLAGSAAPLVTRTLRDAAAVAHRQEMLLT